MATSTLGNGTLVLAGTTSGTTTVTATAVAGTTTLTLPAATDTLVGKATTDTLTNKTLTGAAMNGTVGATTPSTGAFTTLSTTGNITNSNSAGRLDFTGASSAQVWATASSLYLDASSGQSVIIRPNNQVTAGTFSSAGLAVTGLTDISAATSGQIKFPATQNASSNANTLDDYEEGTWSIQLQDVSNNNATMESGFTTATYVKIGRQVTVNGTIYTSSVAALSGGLKVAGLPFAFASGNQFRSAGATSAEQLLNITSGQKLSVLVNPAAVTKFDIYISNSTTGGNQMTAAEWSNDGFTQFSLTYFAD